MKFISIIIVINFLTLSACNYSDKENDDKVKSIDMSFNAPYNKPDLLKDKLRGNVRTTKLMEFNVNNDSLKIKKGSIRNYYYDYLYTCYNKEGYKTMSGWYDEDGSIRNQWIYKYDKYNNILEKSVTYGDTKNYSTTLKMLYYDNGNKMEVFDYFSDGEILWIDVFYYTGSALMKKKRRTITGKTDWTIKYSLDEFNHLKRSEHFDSQNKLYQLYDYKYDNQGNLLWDKKYNSNGLKIVEWEYKYDSYNNLIKWQPITDNNIYQPAKSAVYRYDNHGNWIEKIQYYDGVPEHIEERIITYY